MNWRNRDTVFSIGDMDSGFRLSIEDGYMVLAIKHQSGDVLFQQSSSKVSMGADTWSHIGISIAKEDMEGSNLDRFTFEYFLNGISLGKYTSEAEMGVGDLHGLSMGANGTDGNGISSIAYDETKIFLGAMTEDEIKESMKPGNTFPLPEPSSIFLSLLGFGWMCLRGRR